MTGVKRLIDHLRRRTWTLGRDEGGQAIVFIALTLLLMVVFVMLVINTGTAVSGKIQMINAADATVWTGATWMARGLNTAAILNKTQAYLLSILVVTESLNQTHQIAAYVLYGMFWTAKALEMSGFPLTVIAGYALEAVTQANYIVLFGGWRMASGQWLSFSGTHDSLLNISLDGLYLNWLAPIRGPLWDAIETVSDVEDSLKTVIPPVALGHALIVGRANAADVATIYPTVPQLSGEHCDDSTLCLPILKAAEFSAICDPVVEGKYAEPSGAEPEWTYHFPKDGLRQGSIEYFRKKLPEANWPPIPPVGSFNQFAVQTLTNSLCDTGPPEDIKFPVKDQYPGEQCGDIESKIAAKGLDDKLDVEYHYRLYRWRSFGNNVAGGSYIDDYYAPMSAGSCSGKPAYVPGGAENVPNEYCSDTASNPNYDIPNEPAKFYCREVKTGSATFPQQQPVPPPTNPEQLPQGNTESVGCACLKSEYWPYLVQDGSYMSGFEFGDEYNSGSPNDPNGVTGGSHEVVDSNTGLSRIYWADETSYGCNRCYDVAYELESAGDRDCCRRLVSEGDEENPPEYDDEPKKGGCKYIRVSVLESCTVEGELNQDDLDEYGDLVEDVAKDIIGQVVGDLADDWAPDPWGGRIADFTGDSDAIMNINEDYSTNHDIRIQQLDWTPSDDPAWRKHMYYFGIAYQQPHGPALKLKQSPSFQEKSLGIFAYGAAEIYLPDGVPENLFSQEWRVRFIPARIGLDKVGLTLPIPNSDIGELFAEEAYKWLITH